ncbi:MAG TPA: ThuA domain-containing protein, partial [Polyangiaceae bacterium]|nr:ThuA domain-containing protein [Polyangiaceae bacterium]
MGQGGSGAAAGGGAGGASGAGGAAGAGQGGGGAGGASGAGGVGGAAGTSGAAGSGGMSGGAAGAGGAPPTPGCTPDTGCSSEAPLCDTSANGGLGACKALELLAFYTPALADLAHVSFAKGANEWFPSVAQENGFTYQASSDWTQLTTLTVSPGRIVLFLDNAPTVAVQRTAFESYMEAGGAWMGFHVSAWTDTPTGWSWYYENFLGSGSYQKNTWRPTSAVLRVESTDHAVVQGVGSTFSSAPCEWYAFNGDLVNNPNIEILLSIDPTSYP